MKIMKITREFDQQNTPPVLTVLLLVMYINAI